MRFSLALTVLLLVKCSLSLKAGSGLTKSNNELALDLLHTISAENNVFYSPISISASVVKLLNGANGDTEKELRNLLHIGQDAKLENLNIDLKEVAALVPKNNNANVTLLLANRLYASNEFPLTDSFANAINTINNGSIELVNFLGNARNVTKDINAWVANHTNGKIPLLFRDSLPSETKVALINAVYFFAKWAKPFVKEATTKTEFYNLGANVPALIDTMYVSDRFRVAPIEDLNAQIIELPYAGNSNVSMFVLLPDEVDGIDSMNEKLTLDTFNQAITKLSPQKVQLYFPKFKIESEFDLSEPFEDLDAKTVFSDSADLSGISEKGNLKLSTAIHHAFVDVNEEGTEAAAATGLVAVPLSLIIQPEIRVNRPFTFVIRLNESGLILFMGQIRNLVDEQLLSYGFI